MGTPFKRIKSVGFTIVELLIVIVVIGILALIGVISYNGVQKGAIDKAVSSDLDGISSALTHYQVTHNGQLDSSVAWYSGSGANTAIGYTPTSGDVIDVVVNATQFCVRGYNVNAKTYVSVATAASLGSDPTACSNLDPSSAAYAADPGQAVFNHLTWTQQTASGSKQWKAIASSSDGTKVAAVADSDYIYTSTDSGVHWTQQTLAGSRSWTGITSSSDGTKLAAVSHGYIYTSTDSGVHWTQQATSQYWESIDGSSDGTKLYAGTNSIYASMDSGATWTATSAPFAGSSWIGIGVSSDGTKIVAANNGSYIYTSSDSGTTWTAQPNPGTNSWGKLTLSATANKSTISVQGGTLRTSTNAGVTWTDSGISTSFCNGVAGSIDGQKLIASNGTGVYRSVNGGGTWIASSLPTSACWPALASSDDGTKVFAGMTNGFIATGVYTP